MATSPTDFHSSSANSVSFSSCVVITVHRETRADEQLARLAGCADGSVVLHDADLDAAVRLPARSGLAQLVLGLETVSTPSSVEP